MTDKETAPKGEAFDPARPMTAKKKSEKSVLILKTVNANMEAYGGFVWPVSGPVIADDWSPAARCGNGLHGLLWGTGDSLTLIETATKTRRWVVFSAAESTVVNLGGKVKVPAGVVECVGTRDEAIAFIDAHGGADMPVVFARRTAGDYGAATAGDEGTATARNRGAATAGYHGTATAGDEGTATAGDKGTATAGYEGTATAGYEGTVTAGNQGVLQVRHYDRHAARYRLVTAYVGEDGILPDTAYKLDAKGLFVLAAQ
jgi:hypothetical protein